MKHWIITLFVIALLSIFVSAHAETNKAGEADSQICTTRQIDTEYTEALPVLAGISTGIVYQFCTGELKSELELSDKILFLIEESQKKFKALEISQIIFLIDNVAKEIKSVFERDGSLPNLSNFPEAFGVGIRSVSDFEVADVQTCDSKSQSAGIESCRKLLEAFVAIYNHSHQLIQRIHVAPVLRNITQLRQDWDDFYEKSRSQTALERLVNGAIWRREKEPGSFLAPPNMQYILLHPTIVIENVSDASDGNKTQEGIMLEFVGANWWKRDKWYQLSGGSLVTVYSERPEVQDWGYGVALHFGNDLTLGATSHDGDRGFFVSVDVLTLFKDKKTLVDSYVGKLKN